MPSIWMKEWTGRSTLRATKERRARTFMRPLARGFRITARSAAEASAPRPQCRSASCKLQREEQSFVGAGSRPAEWLHP